MDPYSGLGSGSYMYPMLSTDAATDEFDFNFDFDSDFNVDLTSSADLATNVHDYHSNMDATSSANFGTDDSNFNTDLIVSAISPTTLDPMVHGASVSVHRHLDLFNLAVISYESFAFLAKLVMRPRLTDEIGRVQRLMDLEHLENAAKTVDYVMQQIVMLAATVKNRDAWDPYKGILLQLEQGPSNEKYAVPNMHAFHQVQRIRAALDQSKVIDAGELVKLDDRRETLKKIFEDRIDLVNGARRLLQRQTIK